MVFRRLRDRYPGHDFMRLVAYDIARDEPVTDKFKCRIVNESWLEDLSFTVRTPPARAEPIPAAGVVDLGFGFTMDEAVQEQIRERKKKRPHVLSESSDSDSNASAKKRKKGDRERLGLLSDTSSSDLDTDKKRKAKKTDDGGGKKRPIDVLHKAVPPPPVVPEPKKKAVRLGRRGEPTHSYTPIAVYRHGRRVGSILHNENAETIDAWCEYHGKKCRASRTVRRWDPTGPGAGNPTPLRTARGRPLGFLVAWFFLGAAHTDGSEQAQCEAHLKQQRERSNLLDPLMDGTSAIRKEARAYLEANAEFEPLLRSEGLKRIGEPVEPLGPF